MTNQQDIREQDIGTALHLPVRQEVLQVGKRVVETGRGVRVHKTVTETELRIDEPLTQQALDIEYVTINAWVEGPPPQQRHEGQTLIVPVLEEVLVVEKRLRLKEEIRITARAVQHIASEQVTLREEQVDVRRYDDSGSAAPP
jgi:uncharacterized protein (TIGR02271 family)